MDSSRDVLLNVIAVAVLIVPPFVYYVTARYVIAAWQKPRVPALLVTTFLLVGISVSVTTQAILGANRLYEFFTTIRIVPPIVALVLLATALLVISLPVFYALRQLRLWGRGRPRIRVHHRTGEQYQRLHRRAEDIEDGQ